MTINWEALSVFVVVFSAVALLGFLAARWRPGDLNRLQEWGLAGRRFGTVMSWFLLGGDTYTAYSFIAVPALIYKEGALGFFAVPYLTIIFPLVFIILPRFWTVARHRGYVTPADFVRERFDSSGLALIVALTGILATMPYIALQIYGIEVSIAQMGIPIEISLFVAFVVLAAYTYVSGLRAPAMVALVKDAAIWLVVIVAFIYIPTRLGGFQGIFAAVHQKALANPTTFHEYLPASQYSAYITLALGSALALFLYPHTLTGILATMPYIALQIYGIEVSIAQMGIPIEISLFVAFVVLAAYTYVSGLRAPAMVALVKDAAIWLVVIVAFIYIPTRLGGFQGIFAAVHQKALANPTTFHEYLPASQYSAYITLALGSALALFLYPHTLTGILSTNSRQVVRRNAALLPAYTILIGLIGLMGYMAIAAGIKPSAAYGANSALPALFSAMFPSWFAGFAFAAIAIGALAPAAIMSIAAANLFTRNIYREYFRPACTEREESDVAKTASLVVKVGALAFILFLPGTLAINFQLLSNIWIVQTLPAVFIGLYTNWFHRRALIIGWAGGMLAGTLMVIAQNFESSVFPLSLGGFTLPVYAAVAGIVVNLLLCVTLTPLFKGMGVPAGEDATTPTDYEAQPVPGLAPQTPAPVPTPTFKPTLAQTPTPTLAPPTVSTPQLPFPQSSPYFDIRQPTHPR